ncbi:MAG: PilZ domain-containing protein [Bacillota bacterium]|nr:PilZ domain-containing protein [Bacillota bacterium]
MEILNINDLKTDQKIHFISNNNKFFDGVIKSIHEGFFVVQISTIQENYNLISAGQQVDFIVANDLKAYRCHSKVLNCKVGDNLQAALMETPETVNVIERRQYKRIQCVLEVSYYILPDNQKYTKLEQVPSMLFKKMKRTFTVDISGGGVKLISYDNAITAQFVLVSIKLNTEIFAISSVVRVEDNTKNCKLALKYECIKEEDRRQILDYVQKRSNG